MQLSIRAKIAIVIVIILQAYFVVDTALKINFVEKEYTQTLIGRGLAAADTLRFQLDRINSLGIQVREVVGFDEQCDLLVRGNQYVSYAAVQDLNGNVLFRSSMQPAYEPLSKAEIEILQTDGYIRHDEEIKGRKYIELYIPAPSTMLRLDSVIMVGMDYALVKAQKEKTIVNSIKMQLVLFAVTLLALFGAFRIWLSKPLSKLLQAIREIKAHGLSTFKQIDISSKDEIGELAGTVNNMMLQIQDRDEKLTEYQETLKEMVDIRTRELLEAKDSLIAEIKTKTEMEEKLRRTMHKIAEKNAQLREMSITDPMTEIYNRRYFFDVMRREIERALREHRPLSLLLLDLDDFKAYNDTHGHIKGDDCLVYFASILRRHAHRPADIVARYGGEEFIILLPDTESNGLRHVADMIMDDLSNPSSDCESTCSVPHVTCSIGGITFFATGPAESIELINLADENLYKAKKNGKNCYVLSESNPHQFA